jgi:hypothetical protein
VKALHWTVIALTCACGVSCAATPVLYVATDGNDSWSGRLSEPNHARTDGPLATPQAARDAARRLDVGQPRRIIIRGGEYCLDQPLTLGPEDSGLRVEGAKGERAVLYGGRHVTGWEPDGEHLWAAKLPQVGGAPWDFRMLVVNGRFCKRARLPKTGAFTNLSEFNVPWMSTTGGGWQRKPTERELTTMRYRPEDLGPWLDTKNAELTVYHMWDESAVGVASLDPATNTLTFTNPAGHPPGAFGVHRYVVWNVREGMTEPGQWYLDRTRNRLVYWPLPGEDMTKAAVLAPTMESVIHIAGTPERPATGISILGLTVSVTNTPLKAGGFGAGAFEGAIGVVNARDCRIADCTVARVGGQGIKSSGASGLTVEWCEVAETGACGIFTPGDGNAITDNRVHHVGVTYPSAIAVWGGERNMDISHNEIHDTTYTGIACAGEDHRIEGNHLYRVMQELHDGAAIYITFCKRIVVRGNFAHDIVEMGGYGSSAYYLDEQAEDCLVERNVAANVTRPSHNHMARRNVIRNNIFIAEGDSTLTFPKCADFRFERNVLWAKGKIVFPDPAGIATAERNIVFSAAGKVEGAPANALQVDPLLEVANGVYGFKPGSPAIELGIEPLDMNTVGPCKKTP